MGASDFSPNEGTSRAPTDLGSIGQFQKYIQWLQGNLRVADKPGITKVKPVYEDRP